MDILEWLKLVLVIIYIPVALYGIFIMNLVLPIEVSAAVKKND